MSLLVAAVVVVVTAVTAVAFATILALYCCFRHIIYIYIPGIR